MGKNKKYIIILIIAFCGLVALEFFKPAPVDWSYSFDKEDKIPYGGYIAFNSLEDIFPAKEVSVNAKSLYQFVNGHYSHFVNYIIITSDFHPDAIDETSLLDFVGEGNNVFISALNISEELLDTLNISLNEYEFSTGFELLFYDSVNFVNPVIQTDSGFVFSKSVLSPHFTTFDTLTTTILGRNMDGINFLCVSYGGGKFFLHLQPMAFTNYQLLLGKNTKYASIVLSYLPVSNIIWDQYYKPGNKQASTPIRYILANPALKSAWFLLVAGTIIYMIFEARRRQRIIPIVQPLSNSSKDFVRTIGLLYMNKGDHHDLAMKKASYFFDFVRRKYYVNMQIVNDEAIERLSQISGVSKAIIERIFRKYEYLRQKAKADEQEMMEFVEAIEVFYGKCS